jgi:hypothetical protein
VAVAVERHVMAAESVSHTNCCRCSLREYPMPQHSGDDNKAKALRSQAELCRRLAQDIAVPDLAEKLLDLAQKLEGQAVLEDAG